MKHGSSDTAGHPAEVPMQAERNPLLFAFLMVAPPSRAGALATTSSNRFLQRPTFTRTGWPSTYR